VRSAHPASLLHPGRMGHLLALDPLGSGFALLRSLLRLPRATLGARATDHRAP
jgi:hypothetical protein